MKVGQEIYPKPSTKYKGLQKRKFQFRDEESLPSKKLRNNSGHPTESIPSKTTSKHFPSPVISLDMSNADLISLNTAKPFETFSSGLSSIPISNTRAAVSEISSGNVLKPSKPHLPKCTLRIQTKMRKSTLKNPLQIHEKYTARESLDLLPKRILDSHHKVHSLSNQTLSNQSFFLTQKNFNMKENELSIDINKNDSNFPKNSKKKKTRRGKRKPKNILDSCSLMKTTFNPYK